MSKSKGADNLKVNNTEYLAAQPLLVITCLKPAAHRHRQTVCDAFPGFFHLCVFFVCFFFLFVFLFYWVKVDLDSPPY